MKTSLAWLNDYLDRPVTLDEAAATLTGLGFPTESWEQVVGDDWAMEVEITSNRGDCLSHVGQAREVAAATGRALQGPAVDLRAAAIGGGAVMDLTRVENAAAALCPLYSARVIQGVKVGPSPAWLTRRLQAVGLRSVNNVVDVTNFVMLELGQPLHAFDMSRLAQKRIVVRRAAEGEAFTAIDGSKHTLRGDMLVIADAARPVAVAGVMGGLDSEVGDQTTDILLESAVFAPLSVRQTSRALKLSSDSSYRFERGIDPRGVERASCRAAQLIVELAGGQAAEGVIRVGAEGMVGELPRRTVLLRPRRCDALLGFCIPATRMVELLERLDVDAKLADDGRLITCRIPSFRLDLTREVDLIEEVVRLHGLEHLPVRKKIEIVASRTPRDVAARQRLRDVLVAGGFHEAITFSFLSPKAGEPFLPAGHRAVCVDDDRRKAEPMLRPSLLPSLLAVRKTNQDMGNTQVRLFETAATYSRDGEGRIIETQRLALLADAELAGGGVAGGVRALRGILDELAQQLLGDVPVCFEPAAAPHMEHAARWSVAGRDLGVVGLIDAATRGNFDLQAPVVAAEVVLHPLLTAYPPTRTVRQLPRYPAIERDLSIVVDATLPWAAIEAAARAAEPRWLETLAFITTYRGKPIARGSKSVTLRMTFRDAGGTLRHDQVDAEVARVVERLKTSHQAQLRAN